MAVCALRPRVLYNKRALEIAEALDATCDHLDRKPSFDGRKPLQPKGPPMWVVNKDFQGSEAARLQRNREVLLQTLALRADVRSPSGEVMRHTDPQLRQNRDFVLSAVQCNGLALEHAPHEFKDDKEIVMAACAQNGMALKFASSSLRDDPETCSWALVKNSNAIDFLGPRQRRAYEVALAADTSGKLRDDKAWMLKALKQEPHLLMYASKRLLSDLEVVTTACFEDGLCLAYASRSLRADPKVVQIAVAQNGLALQYAGANMQNNISTVNHAIKQNGLALAYANDALKADKRVVLRALQSDGMALKYAAENLRKDKGVVIRALKQNTKAWQYAHASLRNDPEMSSKKLLRLLMIEGGLDQHSGPGSGTAWGSMGTMPGSPLTSFPESTRRAWEASSSVSSDLDSNRLPSMPDTHTGLSEAPTNYPDHPTNSALIPTWQLQLHMGIPGSSRPGTPAAISCPNAPAGFTRPITPPTVTRGSLLALPTVQHSSSSPALFGSPGGSSSHS